MIPLATTDEQAGEQESVTANPSMTVELEDEDTNLDLGNAKTKMIPISIDVDIPILNHNQLRPSWTTSYGSKNESYSRSCVESSLMRVNSPFTQKVESPNDSAPVYRRSRFHSAHFSDYERCESTETIKYLFSPRGCRSHSEYSYGRERNHLQDDTTLKTDYISSRPKSTPAFQDSQKSSSRYCRHCHVFYSVPRKPKVRSALTRKKLTLLNTTVPHCVFYCPIFTVCTYCHLGYNFLTPIYVQLDGNFYSFAVSPPIAHIVTQNHSPCRSQLISFTKSPSLSSHKLQCHSFNRARSLKEIPSQDMCDYNLDYVPSVTVNYESDSLKNFPVKNITYSKQKNKIFEIQQTIAHLSVQTNTPRPTLSEVTELSPKNQTVNFFNSELSPSTDVGCSGNTQLPQIDFVKQESQNNHAERDDDFPIDFEDLIETASQCPDDGINRSGALQDKRFVIRLAHAAITSSNSASNVAEILKNAMDTHFGANWQVVAGTGAYGSNIGSLGGKLFHFKAFNWAFLIWKTS